ncbi:MAG TPA: hypothetical protein VN366_06615 [Feifaniaceae bacterium]|nr:hypothetical protein [Feifaniaceae bacterium]
MRKSKKRDWPKIISILLFVSLVGSILFVAIRLAHSSFSEDKLELHTRGDYILMLIQCVLGLIVMFMPSFLQRRFSIIFPDRIYVMYLVFLYCSIYLGEVRNFYYLIPFWDSILHGFSGVMLGALGFTIVNLLNREERLTVNLSPLFVSMFALCFAVTLGVLWEIYEFTFDGILGLNMQKFALQGGALFVGRDALIDTMKDLIIDFAGALVMSVIGYFSIKKERDWVIQISLKRSPKGEGPNTDDGEAV